MKNMELTIRVYENGVRVDRECPAYSMGMMREEVKELFYAHPNGRIIVTDEKNNVIKDLILVKKKSGKTWMQTYRSK